MRRQKVKKQNKRLLFIMELIAAILLVIGLSVIGMSNLIWASDQGFPAATNLPGHMAKVLYLVQQIKEGHFPGWFPYWYNGSGTVQYYGPLSYILMALVYWVTDNMMLTYQIFCVSLVSIGGLGVWVFCYKKIGRVCGLVGIVLFCLQPFLLESLYREGVISQGAAAAILPWFLLSVLSCAQKPARLNFIGTVVSVTLLILSNAMQAIIVCSATFSLFLLFLLLKKVNIKNLMIVCIGQLLAGLLAAFWLFSGVTENGNNRIPYLNQDATVLTPTDISWFLPGSKTVYFQFAVEITAISLLGIVCYLIAVILRKNSENHRYYGLAGITLTLITIAFSVENSIPGFKDMMRVSGLAAGSVFIFTGVTGAITGAYAIYMLWNFPKARLLLRPMVLAILILTCIELNPLYNTYPVADTDASAFPKEMISDKNNFDKGRYLWYDSSAGSETLFSYFNHINICQGGNIEETPHNKALNHNEIALELKENNYLLKQMAYWNVRYLLLNRKYSALGKMAEGRLGFEEKEDGRNGSTLYVSNQPSSYFLTDSRNTLVISNERDGFTIRFPNLIQGKSGSLTDYTEQELKKYRLIYIMKPQITTEIQKDRFESLVTKLVNDNVTVMIEPEQSKSFDLFQVHAENEIAKEAPTFQTTSESPYDIYTSEITGNSNLGSFTSLYGLDSVYANFEFENGKVLCPVLGTKKAGKGEVIFVGAAMSQYLAPVYACNNEIGSVDDTVSENSAYVETIYSVIFSHYGVNEDYLPDAFDAITKQSWDYDGVSFAYQSREAKEVTVSVTYMPGWIARLDGKEIKTGQCENLITLDLPAGNHTVRLSYELTDFQKTGYLISAVGLFILLLFLLLWKRIMKHMEHRRIILRTYFQLEEQKEDSNNLNMVMQETAVSEIAESEPEIIGEQIPPKPEIPEEITADSPAEDEAVDLSGILQKTVNENGIKVDLIELEDKPAPEKKEVQAEPDNERRGENAVAAGNASVQVTKKYDDQVQRNLPDKKNADSTNRSCRNKNNTVGNKQGSQHKRIIQDQKKINDLRSRKRKPSEENRTRAGNKSGERKSIKPIRDKSVRNRLTARHRKRNLAELLLHKKRKVVTVHSPH